MGFEISRVSCLLVALLVIAGCASDDDPASDAGHAGAGGDSGAGGGSDTDATTGEECFEELTAPAIGFVEIQRFVSEDGDLSVWRARQPGERSAVGETSPYDLVRVWIDSADEDGTCVTEASALTYTFGHHNWSESWTVTTAHAMYAVHEMYNNGPADPEEWGFVDTLEAKDESGDVLFTAELVEDGCESRPYDLNPCFTRMRIDMPPPGWGEE